MKIIVCLFFLAVLKNSLQTPLEIIFPLIAADQTDSEAAESVESESTLQTREDSVKEKETKTTEVTGRNAGPVEGTEKPKLNILEVLKGMGSAIQLLIRQPTPVTQTDFRSDTVISNENYREQAERLRTEINKRSGQLQKVVSAAIEASNERGDTVVKRILENLQTRLGQAKQRADKILKEPESGELAVRTLNSINQGMGNLSSLVQHVLGRINISINVDLKDGSKGKQSADGVTTASSQTTDAPSISSRKESSSR